MIRGNSLDSVAGSETTMAITSATVSDRTWAAGNAAAPTSDMDLRSCDDVRAQTRSWRREA